MALAYGRSAFSPNSACQMKKRIKSRPHCYDKAGSRLASAHLKVLVDRTVKLSTALLPQLWPEAGTGSRRSRVAGREALDKAE